MHDTGDQRSEEKPANCYEQRQDNFFQQDFDVWQNFTTPQEDEKEAILYEYEATAFEPSNDKYEALNAKDVWKKIKERQNEQFPEDSVNMIDIFEFRRCDPEKLSKDLVKLFEDLDYPGLDGFLDAREAGKSFTGVRLSGFFGEYNKSLLLTSIPILSVDKGRNNSLIHQLQGSPNFGRETAINNHNFKVYITIARCFVMDDTTIVIFKPDTHTFSKPLIPPATHRHGALYFLARIMEISLQVSNDEIVKACRKNTLIHQQMIGDIYKILQMNNATEIPGHVFENASLIGQYIELVDMITGVMNDQVNILEILVKMFEKSVENPRNDQSPNRTSQAIEVVHIPVISGCTEQMPHVMQILDRELIRMREVTRDHERRAEKFRDSYHQLMAVLHLKNMQIKQTDSANELAASVNSANETLKTLSREASAMNGTLNSLSNTSGVINQTLERTRESQSTMKDASKQQLEHMITMSQEAAYQGDLFSFFTVITTLFLPLGFLAQYAALSLDAGQIFMKTHRDFWRVVGPVTSIFAITIALFITFKKYTWNALEIALRDRKKPVSRKKQAIANARNGTPGQNQNSTARSQSTNQASGTGHQTPGLGSAHV